MGIPAIEITKDGTTDISSYLSDENEYPDSGRRRSSSVHQQQQQHHQQQQQQHQQQNIQQSQHVQNQNSPIHQHQVRDVLSTSLSFFFVSFFNLISMQCVVLQPDVTLIYQIYPFTKCTILGLCRLLHDNFLRLKFSCFVISVIFVIWLSIFSKFFFLLPTNFKIVLRCHMSPFYFFVFNFLQVFKRKIFSSL